MVVVIHFRSLKISVQYTPDFYLSRLSHPMYLVTSTGVTPFQLDVTLPHHLLPACHERTPVTPFASAAHSVTVAVVCVLFVVMVVLTLQVRTPTQPQALTQIPREC